MDKKKRKSKNSFDSIAKFHCLSDNGVSQYQVDINRFPTNSHYNESSSQPNLSKHQIFTLIHRYLLAEGCREAASSLSRQLNLSFNDENVNYFQTLLLSGRFEEVMDTFATSFYFEDPSTLETIKVFILKHWYYEIIASGNNIEALRFLRNRLTPYISLKQELFNLIQPILSSQECSIIQPFVSVHQALPSARYKLLGDIQKIAPYTNLTPNDRLEQLLKYSVLYQLQKCPLHSIADSASINCSLFKDHNCTWESLPNVIFQTIECDTNIIWSVDFSHNGIYFAVGSGDKTLAIYKNLDYNNMYDKVKNFTLDQSPSFFKWSYDDLKILVAIHNNPQPVCVCYMHNPSTMDILAFNFLSKERITCGDWFLDSIRFAVGSLEGSVTIANVDGHVLSVLHGFRTQSLVIVNFENYILFSDHLKRIVLWNMANLETRSIWEDEDIITAFTKCPDQEHVLFNVKGRGVRLFSFRSFTVIRTFISTNNLYSAINCSFMPGMNSKMFCCGGKNGSIFYYHLNKSDPVKIIESSLNSAIMSLSWCNTNPNLLVSASSDGVIVIWMTKYGNIC